MYAPSEADNIMAGKYLVSLDGRVD